MNIRDALTICLIGMTGLTGAAQKPNVLFILMDDQRPGVIAGLGNEQIKTPNMDTIVSQGIYFNHAYCQGSNQGAVCVSSRAMLMTGKNVFHIPSFKPEIYPTTFARTMKAAGYATLRTGKKGSTPATLYTEFDENYTITRSATCSREHADNAIKFMREHAGKQPFFEYVEFACPHDPQPTPDEFYAMYKAKDMPLSPNFAPYQPFDNGEMTVRDEKTLSWPRTRESVTGKLAKYYASIAWTDSQIGRILEALKETSQMDNTIIIFAADNGLSLGDHGLLGKQNLYEFGGMHVPLAIMAPRIKPGQTDSLAYLYDIFPTVCELAGIPIPQGLDASSLVPILKNPDAKVNDCAFTTYRDVQRSVRTDRWKLIRYPYIDKTQLYDLDKDPYEMNDLAANPEQAGQLRKMMKLLETQQKQFGDPAPLTVPNPKPAAWTPENAKADGKPAKAPKKKTKK